VEIEKDGSREGVEVAVGEFCFAVQVLDDFSAGVDEVNWVVEAGGFESSKEKEAVGFGIIRNKDDSSVPVRDFSVRRIRVFTVGRTGVIAGDHVGTERLNEFNVNHQKGFLAKIQAFPDVANAVATLTRFIDTQGARLNRSIFEREWRGAQT